MNRILNISLILALLFSVSANAQNVLTGSVCNSKGDPVVGAMVTWKDTTRYTDVHGNFVLMTESPVDKVVISHKGMKKKTFKAVEGMLVLLPSAGVIPEHPGFFLMPQVTFLGEGFQSYGLMFGTLRRTGFYFKFSKSLEFDDLNQGSYGNYEYRWFPENPSWRLMHLDYGIGMIVRLGSPLYMYYGLGDAHQVLIMETVSEPEYCMANHDDIAIDMGFIYRNNHLLLNFGWQFHDSLSPRDYTNSPGLKLGRELGICIDCKVGVGYVF